MFGITHSCALSRHARPKCPRLGLYHAEWRVTPVRKEACAMATDDFLDHAAYERRFQHASQVFSSAAPPVEMARRLALLHTSRIGPGMILAGENRLREARRVGLLASSMNPLTRAHVALAEAAKQC